MQVYKLSELIAKFGEQVVQERLMATFQCQRNIDIERFLFQSAIRFELAGSSRTYLILNENSHILAYFTLAFKSISVNCSKNLLKKLTAGLTNSNQINAFLLGQIGKNSLLGNNPICLKDILDKAFKQIQQAHEAIGGRVVILECENNPKLIKLYEDAGFKLLNTVEDKHQLKTMFIIPDLKNK